MKISLDGFMKIFQLQFKIPVWFKWEIYIFDFDRSGPYGKFSISNFHRSGIGLKNFDLCNTLQICITFQLRKSKTRLKFNNKEQKGAELCQAPPAEYKLFGLSGATFDWFEFIHC